MKYDLYRKQTPGVTLICGGTADDREMFAKYFTVNHPDFVSSVDPSFDHVKKPLFGSYPPIYKLISKMTAKAGAPIDAVTLDYEFKKMGVDHIMCRSPRAMSGGQRLMMTLMLEAFLGKRQFFLREEYYRLAPISCAIFLAWIKDYAERNPLPQPLSIVWLTATDRAALSSPISAEDAIPYKNNYSEMLSAATLQSLADELYSLQNGQIEPQAR